MRSRLGYLFGGALIVFAAMLAGLALSTALSTMRGMQRVVMPGRADITLPSGPSTLYSEYHSHVGDKDYETERGFKFHCSIEDPGMHGVTIANSASSVSYSLGGYAGHAAFDVAARDGGHYTLVCDSDDNHPFVMAIGAGVGAWIVIAGLAAIPLCAGIALVVVTIVRRRRAARRAAASQRAVGQG
ncbi:MAG TPA: hypothetical protein VLX92_01410 [Kofleriaceae bacterium]|nr:hypothetical protein [Kofleriaceae bacterium]